MNAQFFAYKSLKPASLAICFLFALLLTACATPATPTSTTPQPQVVGLAPESHIPVILGVKEWQGPGSGPVLLYLHKDISYTDAGGDAVRVEVKLISATVPPSSLGYDLIENSTEEQKDKAVHSTSWGCGDYPVEIVLDLSIRDSVGNASEPVRVTFTCPAPATRTNNLPSPFLVVGISAGLVLLTAGAGIRVRRPKAEPGSQAAANTAPTTSYAAWIRSTIRPMLLFLFASFEMSFIGSFIHEGGHALMNPIYGVKITTLLVHPFAFSGYVRPFAPDYLWGNLSAPLTEFSLSLLAFLLFWKRRSPRTLPWLMLLPNGLTWLGIAAIVGTSDIYNTVAFLNLPRALSLGIGLLFLVAGILLSCSLFPLCGMAPDDRKAYFALPAAYFITGALSLAVAILLALDSSRLQADFMVESILNTAYMASVFLVLVGLLKAAIYSTVYRRIYLRLPAWLQTGVTEPTGKDLRFHAALFALCLILGLAILPWG